MATIVAQANGNFSDTATWTGGVVPGAGDTAQTGNYIVTIDASITCTLNPTGSGYFLVTSGGITITGDLVMQSSYTGGGLRATHGSGTVALTGTATGGAGNYAYGAFNNGAGTLTVGAATGGAGTNAYGAFNNGAGTLTVDTATGGAGNYACGAFNNGAGTLTVGAATGGAGYTAYGAYNNAAGTLTVGTATGGAGSNAHGAFNADAGTMTVGAATGGAGNSAYGAYNAAAGTLTVGTATGGAGSNAYGAYNAATGTLICDLAIGSNWGPGGTGSLNPGVYGTGAVGQTTKVKRVQSGAYGAPGIWGFVLIEPDAANSAQFRLTPGGDTLTLVDAAEAADFPAAVDVRSGVVFDGGDKVGTCAVPVAANVSYGVPVDATVGTAVLTAAAVTAGVWDAARSGHAGAGTFGATDEWAGSVDEAAIAAAVLSAADSDPISANVTLWKGDAVADLVNGAVPSNVLRWLDADASEQLPQVIPMIDDGEGAKQLTQQVLRDAMKLAPSAGAPAAGSVDAHLDAAALEATAQAILEDTSTTLPTAIAAIEPGGGSYAGDGTGYYSDTIDDGTSPLDGVRVQLYTSPNRVGPAHEAYTNALGVFEMWPDPGTYYRWLDLAGYNFSQDVAVTVTEP